MMRFLTWVVYKVLALGATSAAAATEPGTNPLTRASNLEGIRKVLGLLLGNLFVVSLVLGCVALMLIAAALSPQRVARAEAALRRGRWKTVVLGVVSGVVLLMVAMALGKASESGIPILGVASLLVFGVLVWLGAVGLAAGARVVGGRLLGDADALQSPWRVVGAGGLVIAGSLLVPIFGWALFLYVMCRGVGAATLTLFAGRDAGDVVPGA